MLQSGSNLDLVEGYNVAGMFRGKDVFFREWRVREYKTTHSSQVSSRACLAKTVELAVLVLG